MRKLRFQGIYYLMLVVVFPLSYLVINMMGKSGKDIIVYAIGMYISMMLSLFINMQATLVSGANRIEMMEYYSVFKIDPQDEFLGESIFHATLSLILLILMSFIIVLSGSGTVNFRLIPWFALCIFLMHQISVFMGGLFANPNIASPIINLLYMVIIMSSPVYILPSDLTVKAAYGYFINPFSHVIWLLYYAFGAEPCVPELLSWTYPLALGLVLHFLNNKRWRMATAIEKLTVLR
jgi:ABC-type polysaccharide/polyol phosphate export permease